MTTRKIGEQVIINHGEIKIEVVDIKGSRVKLCFQASKEISIVRYEPEANLQKKLTEIQDP